MVCLLDYFLRLWFFRLSSGFSVLVFGVALWLCDGVWWWWLVLVGFFACWKWPLLLVVVGRFFGFGCNTQQSNVSSMWPIHIIQCFFLEKLCGRFFFRFSFSLVGIWCVYVPGSHSILHLCWPFIRNWSYQIEMAGAGGVAAWKSEPTSAHLPILIQWPFGNFYRLQICNHSPISLRFSTNLIKFLAIRTHFLMFDFDHGTT